MPRLVKKLKVFADHQFFININAEEWRHDFELDNYMLISLADPSVIDGNLIKKNFCKIAGKIGLDEWNIAGGKLFHFYEIIFEQMNINFPGDGRDL